MRHAAQALLLTATVTVLALLPTNRAAAQACPSPYRVLTSDNRCVWSCGQGTRPDRASNTCVCKEGHRRSGRDRFGRGICSASQGQASGGSSSGDSQPTRRDPPSNYAARYPYNTRSHNLCRTYGRGEYAFPYRCRTSKVAPASLAVQRPLTITVRKSAPMQAQVNRPGRYNVLMRRPPNPPRNPDCNEAAIGVPGACRPDCARLDYLTFFASGQLHALLGPTQRSGEICSRSLSRDYTAENPDIALAYDACSRAAYKRRLTRWNHDVPVTITRRVAAAYGFKDAHTTGSRGNWRYQLQMQHTFMYDDLRLPVTVRCR